MAKNKLEEELRKKQKNLLSTKPSNGVDKVALAASIANQHDEEENVRAKAAAAQNAAKQQAQAIAAAHDDKETVRLPKKQIAQTIAAEHDYNEDVRAAQQRRAAKIARDIANMHDFTENSRGTAFGNVSPAAHATITGLQDIWQKAKAQGDLEKAQKAHQAAEAMRVLFGFSGGKEGSAVIETGAPRITEDARAKLVQQGYEAMKQAQQPEIVKYTPFDYVPAGGVLRSAESGSDDKPTVLGTILKNTMAGVGQFNKGLAQTADFFLPDVITPKGMQNVLDYYKDTADAATETAAQNNYALGGDAGVLVGNLAQGTVAALPQAVIAMMTGGASATTSAINTLKNAGVSQNILQKASTVMQNPGFWTSFAQSVGGDYENARENGASETQAIAAALLGSLANAGVEMGGGIETMAQSPGRLGVRDVVQSALGEGAEEVGQGSTSAAINKILFDRDAPIYSTSDDSALINPKRIGQEFLGGAVAGGILSGGGAALSNLGKRVEAQTIGQGMNLDNENAGVYNEKYEEPPVYSYQDGDMLFDEVDPERMDAQIVDAMTRYSLSEEDKDFIEMYTSGAAYELNALQRDVPREEWSEYESFMIDGMADAIAKLPAFKGKTYRNLVFGKPGEKANAYQSFLTEYSEGSIVELKAFTSASKNPNGYAVSGEKAAHLVIDGVGGRDLSDSFSTPRQQEVIFLPGTKIHITKVTTANDGHPLIYAEEVTESGYDVGRNHGEHYEAPAARDISSETGNAGGKRHDLGSVYDNGGVSRGGESGIGEPLRVYRTVADAQEVNRSATQDNLYAALRVLGLGQRKARGDAATEEIRRMHDPDVLPELNQSAGGLRGMHRNIVSGVAELERFAKAQKAKNQNAVNVEDLAQMSRAAGGTVDMIAEKALVDRRGDKIGESWAETVGKLNEEESRRLNLYRQHLHNIDRMSLEADAKERLQEVRGEISLLVELNPEYAGMTESELAERSHWSRLPEDDKKTISDYLALLQEERRLAAIRNKPILSYVNRDGDEMPYTAEQSREEAAKMLHEYPELKKQTEAAEAFHDRFMREWAVESGLMSEQQYDALREKYPHYIQTFRTNQQNRGGDSVTRKGGVNTTDPIRKAVGDISEIVPFEDAEMMQVNSIVRMTRRNELFRNLYDFAKENPKDAAPYVRILDAEALAEIDAMEGFEALSEALEANAMEAKNGSYTLMAMIDGKPAKMQVSADLYAGLQNLYGQDRGAAEQALQNSVGKATTGFKMLTTGLNPLFPVTNLAKDIQTGYINTVSDRKTFATYLVGDVGGAAADMVRRSPEWEQYKALGGKSSGYYHNEKGFKESLKLNNKKLSWDTVKEILGVVGESTESLIRFAEYKAAVRKYGDTQEGRAKAIQAAADVTVNFSRSAPMTRAAENFVPYLNASVQGLDKMVRQYKAHPVQATRRNLEMLTLTTVLLWLINKDDEDYENLNNRTKDNYFCIPVDKAANLVGLTELGVELDGKFLKIPKSREWGAVFSALTERFLRTIEKPEEENDSVKAILQRLIGREVAENAEEAFEGIAGQFFTNVVPSNPVTDNIGKSIFIDLPTNRDFAGRSIVPERLQGLSPENQYDYSTSDAGKTVAAGWNALAGAANNIPGVDVPKLSPIQADYLIDSNLGFVGDAILAYDKDNGISTAGAGKHVLDTLEQKFIADPRYQNGATDRFYDILNAAEVAKNDANLAEGMDSRTITPEEKYYSLLNEYASEISELRKQERELLASDMEDAEREKQVLAIRDQIIDIANNAPEKAQADLEAFKATYVPEISHLSDEKQAQARTAHDETGLSYDAFVRFTDDFSAYQKETKGQEKDSADDVANMLRGYHGLTNEQRDRLFSVYSDNLEKNPFHVSRYEAEMDKSGLYAELTDAGKSEVRALLNDYEQDIDKGKAERGELDGWKAKAYTAEQEAGIAPGLYAQYRAALQIANTDGNSNYSQAEAEKAVRMLGEIGSEKQAYLFASTNSQWKKNPFGSAGVSKYEAAKKEAEEEPELLQEDSKVRDILNALVSTGSSAKSSTSSKPQKPKTLKNLEVLKPLKNLF